jgi:hypothetical protein
MCRAPWAAALIALVATSSVMLAQSGGKPISGGNPTPGTAQPDPPNLADRITLTGCLQLAPKGIADNRGIADSKPDANTPMNTRYALTSPQRVNRLPPGTGGSELTKQQINKGGYRLEGLESQFSPFVNTKVEISGEVKPSSDSGAPPTLLVEFVQRLEPHC